MSKERCWAFVDKDGTEKVSNYLPTRRQFQGKRIVSVMWGLCKGHYSKNSWNKWFTGFSSDKNDFLPFDGAILPKGTIEKLIGYRLTWEDEPKEIL